MMVGGRGEQPSLWNPDDGRLKAFFKARCLNKPLSTEVNRKKLQTTKIITIQ